MHDNVYHNADITREIYQKATYRKIDEEKEVRLEIKDESNNKLKRDLHGQCSRLKKV